MSEKLSADKNLCPTTNPSIFKDQLEYIDLDILKSLKEKFKKLIDVKDNKSLRELLKKEF